jgi:glycosyltransferase involved in cell wall biosynthesis
VLASSSEGLPVVLMEAFALERPVVSTNVGGIRELVEPGESGWLVPPRSVDALAEAMRAVLRADRRVLDAMGRRGSARVAEFHDARTQGARIALVFLDSQSRHATQPLMRARATGILAR